jgi:hypothetical protein
MAAISIVQRCATGLYSVYQRYQQPLGDVVAQAERTQVQIVPSGFETDPYLRVKFAKSGQLKVC